ncbi:MAG: DUF5606 domain-containing protein [Bacteroidaceae bacterium]|nr:DUF5606 domain-containing protein [Bacteroidaceae bacterium]
MKDTILSIAGRPGLYKLLQRGRGMLIVEALDETKKRITAGDRDRVTSLNDVSMYTDDGDVPLMTIFEGIFKMQAGQPLSIDIKKATKEELADFMASALPEYDRDRVHPSDMKKLAQWYNILVKAGYTEFADPEDETEKE